MQVRTVTKALSDSLHDRAHNSSRCTENYVNNDAGGWWGLGQVEDLFDDKAGSCETAIVCDPSDTCHVNSLSRQSASGSSTCSHRAEMPLIAFTNTAMLASRSQIGSLRLAKMVPDVTLNWCWQSLHFQMRRAA